MTAGGGNWIRKAASAGGEEDLRRLDLSNDRLLQEDEETRGALLRFLRRDDDRRPAKLPPHVLDFLRTCLRDRRSRDQDILDAHEWGLARGLESGSIVGSPTELVIAAWDAGSRFARLTPRADRALAELVRRDPEILQDNYSFKIFFGLLADQPPGIRGGETDRLVDDLVAEQVRLEGREPPWLGAEGLKGRLNLRSDRPDIPTQLTGALHRRLLEEGSIFGAVHDLAWAVVGRKRPTGGIEIVTPAPVAIAADRWMRRGTGVMTGPGFSFLCDMAENMMERGEAPESWVEPILRGDHHHWRVKRWLAWARGEGTPRGEVG